MNLTFIRHFIITNIVLYCLFSCSAKRADTNPPELDEVTPIEFKLPNKERISALSANLNPESLRASEEFAYYDKSVFGTSDTEACDYWNSLVFNPEEDEAFQIISNLMLIQGHDSHSASRAAPTVTDNPSKDQIMGHHTPGKVPHLLYFLSKENDDEELSETLKKLHNPPSEQQVRDHIKKTGKWYEKTALALSTQNGVLKLRNNKIIENLESLLPGVITGRNSTLQGKVAFGTTLEPFVERNFFNRDHFDALKIVGKEVPLFISSSWIDREKELRKTLSILDRPNIKSLSFEEKICHFAIYHRVLGQLIRLKGVRDAPKLKPNGLLGELPQKFIDPVTAKTEPYSLTNYPGLFQEQNKLGEWTPVVITSDWVEKKVANLEAGEDAHIRIKDPIDLTQKLGALRYLVTLTSFRNNQLFDIFEEAPDSRPRLLNKLQKMGIAMFGLALNTVKIKEFPDGSGIDKLNARFRFIKDDSANNLAYLIHTLVEALESLERLKLSPTDVDKALLSPSQIDSFAGSANKEGVVELIEKLLMLLMFESNHRINEGRSTPQLVHAQQRILIHDQIRHK